MSLDEYGKEWISIWTMDKYKREWKSMKKNE